MENNAKTSKKVKGKTVMLALGEGSHSHILNMVGDATVESEILSDDIHASIDLLLEGTGVITHEEHDRIVLDQGRYRKYPQQEFDALSQRNRAVFD